MQKTWLLVADASRAKLYAFHKARIFSQPKPQPSDLELIHQSQHADSRKKGKDLTSDKWGEFGSETFVPATPPKEHEAEIFAIELINRLETGRTEKSFRDIIIIAPANFIGLLHKHMSHEIKKLVSQTIEKDYTQQTAKELIDCLADQITS